jgi:hypothetical protein
MIPEGRVRRALLNVERRQVEDDIVQVKAAILHLQADGKDNYDAARKSKDRCEDYDDTSEQILKGLEERLKELKSRLFFLESELALLGE